MAKRKKKQKQPIELKKTVATAEETAPGAIPEPPQVQETSRTGAKRYDAAQVEPDKSPRQTAAKPRKSVSIDACLAGMFLALILGMYLGNLLTEMLHGGGEKSVSRAPAAADIEEPQLDQELARTVAELEIKAAKNPNSAPDWINLGNIYFDASMPAKAIRAYERALELAPKNADVLTDLGIMYRETGQFEKAVESFRRAIAVNPAHENAMFNEGVVLSSDMGRKEDAIAAWRRLLETNPNARSPSGEPLSELIRGLQ